MLEISSRISRRRSTRLPVKLPSIYILMISGFVMAFVTSTRDPSASRVSKACSTRNFPIYRSDRFARVALLCVAPRMFAVNEA
jgi:ABC-type spermidine/putrescine transport system permease subunit II